jgi:protease II
VSNRVAFFAHAGGLTVGATLNLDPSCCAAAIMDVPFLDVLNDMLDPSLLLTMKERREWGDPLNDQVTSPGFKRQHKPLNLNT